jgi:acetylornithine deacetylase/succinyl-diaminopimelate desuccinylase-like protein
VLQLLPGTDPAEAERRLLPGWMTHGLARAERSTSSVGIRGSPLDHPAYLGVVECVGGPHPDAVVGPYLLTNTATDARFFRAAGIAAYGFSPFLIFTTDTFQVGDANERMVLPAYVDGVELYRAVVEAFARGEA